MKNMSIKHCIKCGDDLNGSNWAICAQQQHQYICKICQRAYQHEWYMSNREKVLRRAKKYQHVNYVLKAPRNKRCSYYLGVHIAENLLSRTFKNVIKMPIGNPGYDLICGKGYKVDVKSSCRLISMYSDRWAFTIKRNVVADYFLLIAFNNRQDLRPEHLWMIEGKHINSHVGIGISESTLHKWSEYEQPINDVIVCCDMMRSDYNG